MAKGKWLDKPKIIERFEEVSKLKEEGRYYGGIYSKLALEFGTSRQRIHQIIEKYKNSQILLSKLTPEQQEILKEIFPNFSQR